ncbi:MAG TPA: prolyl oligopeptidase family serine peptidase [Steroidobacteraceae bacterium]|jgi:prolyl oligopeptidase|nr:prolyl oligopeptidase family serine peptidase [Steroidobacteraceae bacterium]
MNRLMRIVRAAPAMIAAATVAAQSAERVMPVAPGGAPPGLAAHPVAETYFGTKVTDRFRFMEAKDPTTLDWMKKHGSYTRSVFDSIEPRAGYLRKLSAFGAGFGFVKAVQVAATALFYLERKPGSDTFDLVVRTNEGRVRTLIDTQALIKAAGGIPQAIDYFAASRDGKRVAVGISAGGSEASQLTVLDVASGTTIAGPVDRAQWARPSWTDDGSALFFGRLQELGPGAEPSDKYLNYSSSYWDLKGLPLPIAGASSGVGPIKDPVVFASARVIPSASRVILLGVKGVQNEREAWIAPLGEASTRRAKWREIVKRDDDVTDVSANATTLYLLTHRNAPTFKVMALPLDGTLADARLLVPARTDRIIESIHAAADGLYVAGRQGLNGQLLHAALDGTVTELKLPFQGSVSDVATDPTQAGAVVALEGWISPPAHFRYDSAQNAFTQLGLDTGPTLDAKRYSVAELSAIAADGTSVPLSVIAPAGPLFPRPTLLDAYGAYGISILPTFAARIPAFADAGAVYAECHVRGGGELGEAWRLGGKDAQKPNSWRDLIACAETLIAKGYTTRDRLTIQGTSAGGITVGRAATERPELFAGAVARVGDVDSLRSEVESSGPANIPEFGTFKEEQGFRNLLAMDAYQHVRNDARYPAFLLTTGLNDPRVEPWEPAKMAARLMEVPGHQPVLLRIEGAAGHGMGTTKSTRDAEDADIAAFVFWRAGVAEWQPKK